MDKEAKRLYQHNYYLRNKEIFKKRAKVRIYCDICHKYYLKGCMTTHVKTQMHLYGGIKKPPKYKYIKKLSPSSKIKIHYSHKVISIN